MSRKTAVATRLVTRAALEKPDAQVLKFDFAGKTEPAKGPSTLGEASTLKEAIIRWLEGQL